MKDLTSSIYTFEKLIQGGFLYVDKTEFIWNLVCPSVGMYFLSRPRRFGKSLTLSTLKAVFEGKKELFQGLAIYDKPYDWKKYPVIHLSMNGRQFDTVEHLEDSLCEILMEQADRLHVDLQRTNSAAMFQNLIDSLKENTPVLLIDEYDKPLLNNVSSPDIQNFFTLMKSFYSVIKDRTGDLRFVFVTGVTKFCHTSLFSDLNNLADISMDADYATMLGYTQQEFEKYFLDWILETEAGQDLPHDKYLAEIKAWYDGYKFHANAEHVYNPVSLACFFNRKGEFSNYWFATGTPTFLFELMKKQDFNFSKELNSALSDAFFAPFELNRLDPLVLLYQTGYLTIAECRQRQIKYINRFVYEYFVKFPNREVEDSFNNCLLGNYAGVPEKDAQRIIVDLIESVGSGDVENFMKILKGIFAGIPYDIHIKHEHYYQTVIYVIFDMLRLYIDAEHCTNDGRIDLMLSAGDWIYVIELKMDKSAGEALKQIENKDYALKFQNRGKRIMAIGINFDSEHGQIKDWLKEEISAS